MGGSMPGLLFLVWSICVLGAVQSPFLFVGLVKVVTCSDMATLCIDYKSPELGVAAILWVGAALSPVAACCKVFFFIFLSSFLLAAGDMKPIESQSSTTLCLHTHLV